MSSSDLSYGSGDTHHLSEVRIVLLGCKKAGKSSSGNTILGRDEFALRTSTECVKRHGEVAGRKITVVEVPGWQRNKAVSNSTESFKQKIVLSASTSPPGPHAVLLVLRLDVKSWKSEKNVLEGYLGLLGDDVWNHTIVLFTFGDTLRDTTLEHYMERREEYIQWLTEKCGNRYHVFNNEKRDDVSQVTELLEKIEEMVAGNRGCHFEMGTKAEHKTKKNTKKKKEKERKVEDSAAARTLLLFVGLLGCVPLVPPDTVPSHIKTLKQISNRSVQHPEDIQVFTPELVKKFSEDKNEYEYRYLFPHAGRFKCEVTELVFEMEDKGQVLYRIVSWDRHLLDGLSQKMPAGPLYSIDCLEGSVRELHLPHCETDKDKVELTVAHVTGGNLEIIPPLRVTNTHVVINIKHLSCFGLLRALLPIACPINAQVLLFYEKGMSTLYIHLVPGNVPFQKVQQIHESSIYIMTTSKCQLTPGKIYRPLCKTDHDYVAQPEDEVFEPEHYNNYHPTFEVLFYTEVNSVKLSISDKNGQVVWRPREVRFKGTEAASANMDTAGADFVDKHRKTLIQSVTSVMEIADCLYSKNMISYEMYSNIKAKATPQDQMRELYTCLNSKRVKAEFYKILREKHHYLVEDLEKGQA